MADDSDHRIISRDLPNGGRVIAVVKTGSETVETTDDDIIDSMLEWSRRRRLRAVDDE